MMVRKGLLVVAAALGLLAAGALTAVADPSFVPGPSAATFFQQQVLPSPTPAPLGESITVGGAELAVDNALIAPSQDTRAMTEVRAAVTVNNAGDAPIDYEGDAWISYPNSSTFRVIASNGEAYGVDRFHPEHASVPGSNISRIEPGYAGRWTVGFQVPTAYADGLVLEWVLLGQPIAAWDLSSPARLKRWDGPAESTAQLGSSFTWSEDLSVTPLEMGQLMCGDPVIEHAAHIVTLTFEVTNSGATPVVFPGVDEPATPATLLWRDGTAADFVLETFVGTAEPLGKLAATKVHIPAGETVERAFVFTSLRDGRMVDVTTTPATAVLNAPAGRQIVDLEGVAATVSVAPEHCDLGFGIGPIPYASSPGAKYAIGGEGTFVDPVAQDAAARAQLERVMAGASLYYDANGRTFDDLTPVLLAPFTPGVALRAHDVGITVLKSALGVIYIDTDDEGLIFAITQSGSGTWFCASIDAYESTTRGVGVTAEEASRTCWSEAFTELLPDEPSSGEEGTTTTTTTTTTAAP